MKHEKIDRISSSDFIGLLAKLIPVAFAYFLDISRGLYLMMRVSFFDAMASAKKSVDLFQYPSMITSISLMNEKALLQ